MYTIMRMEMVDILNRYSETVLLFGDNSLAIESNEAIFRAVINTFIKPYSFHLETD